MATVLSEDSVLLFLRGSGGTVKNAELLAHFRPFLRDHDDRLRHRDNFKKFVNSVATVKQVEGVSYVVLRRKFRAPRDAVNPSNRDPSSRIPDGLKASDPGAGSRSCSPAHQTPGKTLRPPAPVLPSPDEPRLTPTPKGDPVKAESQILVSAGIILNNNNDVKSNFNLVQKPLLSSTPDVPQPAACRLAPGREEPVRHLTQAGAPLGNTAPTHPLRCPAIWPHKPVDPRVENHPVLAVVQSIVETRPRHDLEEYHLQGKPSPILHQHEGLHHNQHEGLHHNQHEGLHHNQHEGLHHNQHEGLTVRARGARYRKSYKSAVSQDGEEEEEEEEATEVNPRRADSAGGEIPLIRPQDNRGTILSSLPPSLPYSLPPSLPSSQPPMLPSLPPSLPSSQPPMLPSLPPSLPSSQPPMLPSLPSSQPPMLPSLPPSLPSSQPLMLLSVPPSLPSSQPPMLTSLTPSLPSSQPLMLPSLPPVLIPSLPSSQPPTLPSPPPAFPFPLHSSLPYSVPPSITPSLPSAQPPNLSSLTSSTISTFLSPSPPPLSQTSRRLSGSPGSGSDSVPTIHIQEVGETGLGWGSGAGSPGGAPGESSGGTAKWCGRRGPGGALGAGLSSSQDSLLLLPSSSSCSDWLSPLSSSSPSGAEWSSSHEELGARQGDAGARVAHVNRLLSLMHRSEQKTTTPWHHSTGHLLEEDQDSSWRRSTGNLLENQEEAESSGGSPTLLRERPGVARRVSSRLRSRNCMSLGAGLDLPFPGEEEVQGVEGGAAAARQQRLQLLSSSLNLGNNLSTSSLSSSSSTPPRFPSAGELAEGKEQSRGGGAGRGTDGPHNSSYWHRQVPLESREHSWLVQGAAGAWTDIYSLFRDDPSLLQRPDFISGFTVLHWIAKHGDHRVLNTLCYGVEKTGMTLEVNVRSWSGLTPLHLAAMHGHKKMLRLLVQKFHADTRIRDTAGKRAWHYLEAPAPTDLLHLLGAPPGAGGRAPLGTGGRATLHHHASCSSADRPQRRPLTTGSAGVKRSTSIAAFLKHKTLLRFRELSDVCV